MCHTHKAEHIRQYEAPAGEHNTRAADTMAIDLMLVSLSGLVATVRDWPAVYGGLAVSYVLAFADWLNSLPPLIGAVVGAASMLATMWLLVRGITWLRFMVAMEQLPGPMALPWLGNSLQLLGLLQCPKAWHHKRDPASHAEAEKFREELIFIRWARKFLPLFRLWVGPVPAVIITDPSVAREILGPNGPLTKSRIYKFIQPWLKTGLLTSTGTKWRGRRKLITPSFHFDSLHIFYRTFVEQANILGDRLEASCALQPKGVHVYRYVTNATLDIISKCAFGHEINAQALQGEQQPYAQAVNEQTESIFARVLQPWYFSNRFYFNCTPAGRRSARSLKVLHEHSRTVMNARKAELQAQRAAGGSLGAPQHFLDTLLMATDEAGQPLNDDAVQEEVDTFLFEGHDTTASGITWALYYIGCFPEVQQRLHEEIDRVMGDAKNPTLEQVQSMPFLNAVIKESLRLSSPVPYLGRSVHKDITIGKHRIPAGAQVFVCPVILHHHEDTWENSWEFRPERFLDGYGFNGKPLPSRTESPDVVADDGSTRTTGPPGPSGSGATRRVRRARSDTGGAARKEPYAFVAFSAGSRGCIGRQFAVLEEKAVLATLLHRFSWRVPEEQEIRVETGIIMRPKNGRMLIHFQPRRVAQASSYGESNFAA